MKRPAFQFYTGDWQRNAKLRRCTHAERGIWIEVLCLMHDSEEYGVLRWPLKDIAQAVNCRVPDIRSLVTKGVMKGGDDQIDALIYRPRHAGKVGEPIILLPYQTGPIWYSSRMVRDEYVRTIRGESTRFGEQNHEQFPTPKAAPKPPIGDGSSASTSASTSKESKAMSGKPDLKPPAIEILDFLNLKAHKAYRPTDSNLGFIMARLREGATAGDCKQVIAKKVREWGTDEKMEPYLRPATLFNRTKFDQYVGELVETPNAS